MELRNDSQKRVKIMKKMHEHEIDYKGWKILITDKNPEDISASAIVIPSSEQLSPKYISQEYKGLVDLTGREYKTACTHYKEEHIRLKTGFATVFPSGKLNCDKTIPAAGPVYKKGTNNHWEETQLMKKTMFNIFDRIVDFKFSKIKLF